MSNSSITSLTIFTTMVSPFKDQSEFFTREMQELEGEHLFGLTIYIRAIFKSLPILWQISMKYINLFNQYRVVLGKVIFTFHMKISLYMLSKGGRLLF